MLSWGCDVTVTVDCCVNFQIDTWLLGHMSTFDYLDTCQRFPESQFFYHYTDVMWSARRCLLTMCATRRRGVVAVLLMYSASTWASLATTHRSPCSSPASRKPSAMASITVIVASVKLTCFACDMLMVDADNRRRIGTRLEEIPLFFYLFWRKRNINSSLGSYLAIWWSIHVRLAILYGYALSSVHKKFDGFTVDKFTHTG